MSSTLLPMILSGGAGTRLWPLSREAAPKPFMPLPDGETLLGKTAARACALAGIDTLVTITNRDYYFHTKDTYAGDADAGYDGGDLPARAVRPQHGARDRRRRAATRSRAAGASAFCSSCRPII